MQHRIIRLTACLLALVLSTAPLAAMAAEGQPSDWAAKDVATAIEHQLIGFDETTDYQSPITRLEFADLALRLYQAITHDDLSGETYAMPFTDTTDHRVAAAHHLGIMNGVSDTQFEPNRSITRMEICVLIQNCLSALLYDPPVLYLSEATQASSQVPSWATTGVNTAIGTGLMTGTGDGYNLAGTASREQATLLMLRLYNTYQTEYTTHFTDEEIVRIQELKALKLSLGTRQYDGPLYATQPSVTAPYAPGGLHKGVLDDGLNSINYFRTLAGLPADITYTDAKNQSAQAGALLLVASEFSHTPSRPADMDEALYQAGRNATSSSNIGMGEPNLSSFTYNCMWDSHLSNMAGVGHRRGLLSPNLCVVGLGFVNTGATTTVFGQTRSPALQVDAVYWPAQGLFPADLFDSGLVWSCSLDPDKFDLASAKDLAVTITSHSDGKVYSLDQSMATIASNGPYLNVSTVNYGYRPAVVFRPGVEQYASGDSYTVTIEHIPLKSGGTTTLTYTFKLFN